MSHTLDFIEGFEAARKLAVGVVQLAREGRLDTDFRSIKSFISGLKPSDTIESVITALDSEDC